MFNLCHILEFVIYSLDNRPFSDQDLVRDGHESAFHVVPEFRKKPYAIHKQFFKQPFAYVPLVPDKFPRDVFQKSRVLERIPVIHIARGQHETEQFSLLIAHKVQLETIEPAHGTLSPLRQALEYPVQVYPLVTADPQGRTVNETYPSTASHQTLLQEQDQRHENFPLQLREPVVRYRGREQMPHMWTDILRIEVFKALEAAEVKQYHDRHHFRV